MARKKKRRETIKVTTSDIKEYKKKEKEKKIPARSEISPEKRKLNTEKLNKIVEEIEFPSSIKEKEKTSSSEGKSVSVGRHSNLSSKKRNQLVRKKL